MIRIKLEGKTSIDQALKKYKMRFTKHQIMDELKERTTYTKKSVERRDELLKAKYRDKKRREENGE
jgi:small subunit ribosomal protein S21